MVAFDNCDETARPYRGVLSFERSLPFPQFTFPLIFGLAYGLFKILEAWPHPWASSVAGIDDLARLAQARDLLNGQGWFDLLQTRLDPPDGVWMHWSRFVDAPIAGLMWLGERTGAGDAIALLVWPVLLMVVFFIAIALASRALAGDRGIFFSVLATLFFASTLRPFEPGRIDHHNVQIVLSALLLLSLLRLPDGRRWGIAAGAVAALMIAIGIETLPLVAVGAAVTAGLWLWDGPRFRAGTGAFGLSFAGFTALAFVLSVPVSRYSLTQCDSLSLTHLTSAVLGGTAIALACALVPAKSSRWHRGAWLGLIAVVCGGVAVALFSDCLGDPYAFLGPEVREVWLDKVSEARSAFAVLSTDPSVFLAAFVPLGVLFAVIAWAFAKAPAESRWKWAVLAAFALTGVAVSLVQMRFIQIAHIFCIPAAAWLMSQVYGLINSRGATALRVAALAAVPIAASPWIVVLPKLVLAEPTTQTGVAAGDTRRIGSVARECQSDADRAAMAATPPGVVAAPIFFGSTILGLSDLPVLAAPYHRAQGAILDAHAIFSGDPDAALRILQRRNIDYVMLCTSSGVRLVTGALYPGSLVAALENGTPPDWLERISADDSSLLHIYRVRAGR